jgi:hypothetical protein
MARQRLAWTLGVFALLLAGPVPAGPTLSGLPQFEQPGWHALTSEQRTILAPLADDWAAMDAFRRKKWIGIAQRYPDMTPAEQASMRRNMREWAVLAPEERKAAREKFKTLKKASPERRQAVRQKWDEYLSLPQEERDKLRSEAKRKLTPPKKPPLPLKSAPTVRQAK